MGPDGTAAGFSGIVLAGGTAARMDGVDKAGLELGGRTLLEWTIDAFLDADEVVVVGPRSVPTTRPVTFTREDPPKGGPVAGLLTGVDALLQRESRQVRRVTPDAVLACGVLPRGLVQSAAIEEARLHERDRRAGVAASGGEEC